MADKKIHVEKIINDIRFTQTKVEGYIMKGRNNKEVDYGFKQPKLEPGIGKVYLFLIFFIKLKIIDMLSKILVKGKFYTLYFL